jgi:hypothetical protein
MTDHIVLWKAPHLHSYFVAASAVGNHTVISIEPISGDTPHLPHRGWIVNGPPDTAIKTAGRSLRQLPENRGFPQIR